MSVEFIVGFAIGLALLFQYWSRPAPSGTAHPRTHQPITQERLAIEHEGMKMLLLRRGVRLCPACCNQPSPPEDYCTFCRDTGEINARR
jgi:hypothetical protein